MESTQDRTDARAQSLESRLVYLGASTTEPGNPLDVPTSSLPGDTEVPSAADILQDTLELLSTRGAERDCPGGERSMARCVEAFNAMTGHKLSEEDGWLFMRYLKDSRKRAGGFKFDDYADSVGYAALEAECAAKHQGN